MKILFIALCVTLAVAHELCYETKLNGLLYTSPEATVNRYCAYNDRTCCSESQDLQIANKTNQLANLTAAC